MELKILNTENKEVGKQKMPTQFEEEFRPDLIKRAVESTQANKRQPYGADPEAGIKSAAKLSRRRRKYKSGYGKGLPRVPRKTMLRRGMQMVWVGAFAPGTVGGRKAHAPVARDFSQKMNDKERRKAIRSALSATIQKLTVQKRGHKIPTNYPFIISNDFEKIENTKDAIKALHAIGLTEDLQRADNKHIRSGHGKARGRKYKQPVGPLIVVAEESKIITAAQNIPGVEITDVNHLSAEQLAPGTHPGRLTLYTQAAIQKMEKENLYK